MRRATSARLARVTCTGNATTAHKWARCVETAKIGGETLASARLSYQDRIFDRATNANSVK